MPRPPKTPKPRPSRGKSGKPTPPPVETAAGTPGTKGFGEAPQAGFNASASMLPALRGQALSGAPRPPMAGESLTGFLDALLAKPAERSDAARSLLAQQPMLAEHPLVSGDQPTFMPHRPERPEKS
jgi:excinuclease ABC subunit B